MPVISLFFAGVYTEEETVKRLLPQKLKDQIVFKTEKSLQYLKFVEVVEVNKMTNEIPFILDYYDREVSKMINQKYGFSMMDSYKKFLMSETYKMLSNPELEMWEFSENGIFDMWETEQITGNPRNSLYIRRD